MLRKSWLAIALTFGACGDDDASTCATCDAGDTSATAQDSGGTISAQDSAAADTPDVACDLACPAPTYCDTGTGFAQCVCPEGYAGSECQTCATGWRQLEEGGACVPSCARVAVCGQGSCNDDLGPVTCTCPPGRVGNRCEACAPGLAVGANDRCTIGGDAVEPGAIVVPIADGSTNGYALARVDPESGALTPIEGRYLGIYGTSIAWDGDDDVYLVAGYELRRSTRGAAAEEIIVDLEPLRGDQGTFVGPAIDVAGDRAFVVLTTPGYSNADSQILEVDLTTGAVEPIGLMFQRTAKGLAWDDATQTLWFLTETEIARFDPETGFTTPVRSHATPLDVDFSGTSMALTDDALVVSSTPPDATVWLRRRCAELAERFGTDADGLVPVGTYRPTPEAATLVGTTADGGRVPSLVVYGALGVSSNEPPIEIEVATTHPDDVVCVMLQSVSATVRLAEGATPRQVIVMSYSQSVQITGPATYEPHPGQLVTIGSGSTTYGESEHYEAAAIGVYGYAPVQRDTLVFIDRDAGSDEPARGLTLPSVVRDLPGVTTAP